MTIMDLNIEDENNYQQHPQRRHFLVYVVDGIDKQSQVAGI